MTPATLLSLACAIANNGPIGAYTTMEQLTDVERAQVELILEDISINACLPENLENHLRKTMDLNSVSVEMGTNKENINLAHEPCDGCF